MAAQCKKLGVHFYFMQNDVYSSGQYESDSITPFLVALIQAVYTLSAIIL